MTRFPLFAGLLMVLTILCLADDAENITVVQKMISAKNERGLGALDN